MHKCSYVHLDICAAGWGQGQVGGLGGIQTLSDRAGQAGGVYMFRWDICAAAGRAGRPVFNPPMPAAARPQCESSPRSHAPGV